MEWFTLLEWLLSKRPEIKNVGENVEKTKFSYSIGGNVNWCNRYGKQGRFLKKFRTKLPYQGIYPKNMKTLVWKDRCTIIFIIALFTIAKIWKQPTCASTDEWIKNMLYVYVYIGASLVAQVVKNLPAMWENWVQLLGWEDPLVEGMATHPSILAWRIHMYRGAWWAIVHGVTKSQTQLSD